MKKNITRNALIGLAFLVSLLMIYFGINFLKGVNVTKQQNQYYVLFDDVTHLLLSSPVYVKGYQIGLINEINMVSADPMLFAVGINLEKELQIPEGSALSYGIDLFGASTASLIMGSSDRYLAAGDTLTGTRETGMMEGVTAVMPKADSILLRIDSVLYTLHRLIAHPAWETSITGMGSTIDRLNHTSASLSRIVHSLETDLPAISSNLNAVSGDLKKVSGELSQMDMSNTFATIDETVVNLKQITAKLNSTDNSMGLLLNDTKLHDSLNVTIDTATKLLEDIRQNPGRYLSVKVRLF